jgi:hypothetical protein
MFSKLISVAYTDEEKEEKFPGMAPELRPEHPYELCITLDEITLKKLGLEESNPEPKDIVDIRAFGRVTGVHTDARDGEETRCRVEIQITDIAVEDEDDEESGEDDDDDED